MLGEEPSLLARRYVDRPLVATLGNQAYGTIIEATRALSGLADARAGSPGRLGDPVGALFLQFGGRLVQTRPRSAVRPSGPFRRKLAHPRSTSASWRIVRARSKPRRRRASITPAIPSLALPVSWTLQGARHYARQRPGARGHGRIQDVRRNYLVLTELKRGGRTMEIPQRGLGTQKKGPRRCVPPQQVTGNILAGRRRWSPSSSPA